ncbi:MAG: ATP-grasp domain-containing protein, partial [Terriglobia bacterium]
MILLWGTLADGPLMAVSKALQRQGSPFFFLDQNEVLASRIEFTAGANLRGRIYMEPREIDLEIIQSVYLRPYDFRGLSAIESAGPASAAWLHAAALDDAIGCWLELTPALVVNRPSAMASNGSKPYQSSLIRAQGFDVPETLITTDANAALEFWEKHGTVIYKSVSAVRSIVSKLKPEHSSRLKNVAHCPTQFQEYIAGTDYRVHVVGEDVFPCEIKSEADDYRYAGRQGKDVEIRACAAPPELLDRCRTLALALGLPVAGVDLRLTPEGKWYCFEVNPSPGFTYYEDATGLPI